MKRHNLVIFLVVSSVLLQVSEGSQKKDAAATTSEKQVLISQVNNTKTSLPIQNDSKLDVPKNIQNNQGVEVIVEDQSSSMSENTPKVVRHLGPKVLRREKLFLGKMIKRPWFSSKISDRSGGGGGIRILKKMVRGGKLMDETIPEIMRYAPRSLDMGLGGLINYNNLESYYGNQALSHPTSGNPNSLDHLYLPEFVAKDYMKPLDFNGLANLQAQEMNQNGIPYAEGFGYQPNKQNNNFRGNPVDINYHNDVKEFTSLGQQEPYNIRPSAPMNVGKFPPPLALRGGGGSEKLSEQNHNTHGLPPPLPPQDDHNEGGGEPLVKPSNFHKAKENSHSDDRDQNEKSPTGSDEVQGDSGLWGILDLAHLLQNSNGLPLQLLNNANSNFDAPNSGGDNQKNFGAPPQSGGSPPPDRGGGNYNSLDDSGPESGNRGGRYNHFDGPESDGPRGNYNNFDGPGPSSGTRGGGSKTNHFDTPGYDRGSFNQFNPSTNGHRSNNHNKPYGGRNRGSTNNHNNYDGPGSDFGRPGQQGNNGGYDGPPEPENIRPHGGNGGGFDAPIPEHGRPHGGNNGYDAPIPENGRPYVNGNNNNGFPPPDNEGYNNHNDYLGDIGDGENYNGNYPDNSGYHEKGGNNSDGPRDYSHGGEFSNDRHGHTQRQNRPKNNNAQQKPPYRGGFDEDGQSYYNSQEQFDGPRKPYLQSNEQGHPGPEGTGQDSFGGNYDK